MQFQLLAGLLMPLLLGLGGLAAWRATKRQAKQDEEPPLWRDTSLDDWRIERDRLAEEERQQRSGEAKSRPASDASVGQEQQDTKRHQRIGG